MTGYSVQDGLTDEQLTTVNIAIAGVTIPEPDIASPMSSVNPFTACRRASRRGFALVVTLSLMILLTVIAVGLLSISSIALRSSGTGEAMARARANARMAMILALGELQKQTGPDTRVTARADVLDAKNPPVLGVWKSWEGTDHETTGAFAGRPVSPGSYAAKKKARFLAWLVSGNTTSAVPDTTPGASTFTF